MGAAGRRHHHRRHHRSRAEQHWATLVFIELPELERDVAEGEACATVESVKAASELCAAGRPRRRGQRNDRRRSGDRQQRRRRRGLVLPHGIDDTAAFEELMDRGGLHEFVETL